MNALSLFSGIGGLDLAAEMAGIKVKAFCEIEPFPVAVLTKRFPGVPIFEDVRKLTAEVIRDKTGMGTSQSIDIIFGGFPCQDLSQAGKQVGLTGARSGLWFEMLRVISELRPRYVIAENVRGAVNLALDTVYSNLVNEGYKVYPYVIPASAVGAPHQRERLFVVGVREDVAMAYSRCELRQRSGECREVEREAREGVASDSEFSSGTLCPSPVASDGSCGGIISPDDTYVQKESGLFRKINRNGTDGSVGLARMVKLWPTPNVCDQYSGHAHDEGRHYLRWEVKKLWPTPSANEDACGTPNGKMQKMLGNNPEVRKTSGQLNPAWVEQLMNFPEGWTDLEVDEPSEWAGWPAHLGQEQYPYEHPRTTTGCKDRAKRLKALGNAVVPAQAYPFFRAIAEIEKTIKGEVIP